MKWSLSLGKIAGIKVNVHWTFLILIGWVVISQAYSGANTEAILWVLLFVFALFACVTLHELGHALAARRYHFETRDITLLPIGGLARLEGIPEKPSEELVVAAAGPMVNVVIAGLLYLGITLSGSMPSMQGIGEIQPDNFLYLLMQVNVALVVFNLIPAFPMDGGRMFRALLAMRYPRTTATRIAAAAGQMLAILFVFIGLFYNPFLVLIGIFVYLGAQSEAEFEQSRSLLRGHVVQEVIMHHFYRLRPDQTIADAVAILLDSQARDFLVTEGETVVGTLSRKQIIEALAARGKDTPVRDAMNPEVFTISADMPLETLMPQLAQKGNSLVPVLSGQTLVGVIDVENLTEFLMIQEALHKKESGTAPVSAASQQVFPRS
jgi:Zn-dependent protease/predicted transcriptional regulator